LTATEKWLAAGFLPPDPAPGASRAGRQKKMGQNIEYFDGPL
jgi:hypothetical protein